MNMPGKFGSKIDRIVRFFKPNNPYWETGIAKVFPISGDAYEYFYLQRINTSASIAVLLLTTQGEFVLLTQYRVPVDTSVIEPVAGLVEGTATLRQTIEHECIQEAGYKARRLIPTGKIAPSAGATSEVIYTFLGLDAEHVGREPTNEPTESTIEILVCFFPELQNYLEQAQKNGDPIDPKIGHILNQALLLGVPEIVALYREHIWGVLET